MKNFFLACKELRIETTTPKTYYGCFYLGPFRDSQALTVANALRRTLLTDIAGLAVTSAKIEGVTHEYSVLKGVRETTMDILLNLKDIVITKTFQSPIKETQFVYLQARGPGIVRAKDLKLPPMFQCINPDQYIATLSEDGELILTVTIDEGKNFIFRKINESFSDLTKNKNVLPDAFLEIDSIFTPIKKVNYSIESYGSETIYTKNQIINLEIWTNGNIHPKEALSQALNSLNLLFNQLGKLKVLESILTTYSLTKNKKFRTRFETINRDLTFLNFNFHKKEKFKNRMYKLPFKKDKTIENNFLNQINDPFSPNKFDQNIINLGLPFRIFNLLYKSKVVTVEQLINLTEEDLKKNLNFDDQLIKILNQILKSKNLTLK